MNACEEKSMKAMPLWEDKKKGEDHHGIEIVW